MDTVSRNYKNSKAPIPHRLLLIVTDKINKKISDKHVVVSNLSIYYTWKNIKKSQKIKNLKYQLQHGVKNLNYLMGHILYQIFKIILSILLKNGEETNKPLNKNIRK